MIAPRYTGGGRARGGEGALSTMRPGEINEYFMCVCVLFSRLHFLEDCARVQYSVFGVLLNAAMMILTVCELGVRFVNDNLS